VLPSPSRVLMTNHATIQNIVLTADLSGEQF